MERVQTGQESMLVLIQLKLLGNISGGTPRVILLGICRPKRKQAHKCLSIDRGEGEVAERGYSHIGHHIISSMT